MHNSCTTKATLLALAGCNSACLGTSIGSVATLQEGSYMLRQCSFRHRFPVCSSGGNSNRKSSFWRLVGICVFPCRTGTSRSCSPRRAGDSRGSRRFLDLSLRAEIRIPAPEGVLPLFVEHTGSYLQEKMCSTLTPPHLLSLHHPFAYDLIDRRLDETGSDLFPVAIAFPVIRHELLVTLDVGV